ncbi:hypothetical protein T439DRAFT_377467 [Meredithblackwellia eburnea MCA 4105]
MNRISPVSIRVVTSKEDTPTLKGDGAPAHILRLPTELLIQVLSDAVEYDYRDRNVVLSGASRVCRRWKRPAQYLLGMKLMFRCTTWPWDGTSSQAQKWIDSGAERLSEPKYVFFTHLTSEICKSVLERCTSVTSLSFKGDVGTGLSRSILRLRGLANLRRLTLDYQCRFEEPESDTSESHLDLALEYLEVDFNDNSEATTLYFALFQGASKTLRWLHLTLPTGSTQHIQHFSRALHLLSESLQHITFLNPEGGNFPALSNALSDFKNLRNIDLLYSTGTWNYEVLNSISEGSLQQVSVGMTELWTTGDRLFLEMIPECSSLSDMKSLRVDFSWSYFDETILANLGFDLDAHLDNLSSLYNLANKRKFELVVVDAEGEIVDEETYRDLEHWKLFTEDSSHSDSDGAHGSHENFRAELEDWTSDWDLDVYDDYGY